MVRKAERKYVWAGPDRFIPPFGDMSEGVECVFPTHIAEQFIAKGWLKPLEEKDSESKSNGSKTVKMSDNVGIGDSGK